MILSPRTNAFLRGFAGAVLFLFAAGIVGGVAAPAWAQNDVLVQGGTQPVLDRLDRLERDIRTLNRQFARVPSADTPPRTDTAAGSSGTPASVLAPVVEFTGGETPMSRVLVRMTALEGEVRAATGVTEKLTYRVDQLTAKLDKLIKDLDYRLARLEGAQPLGTGTATGTGTGNGTSPVVSPVQAPSSTQNTPAGTTRGAPQAILGTISKEALDKGGVPPQSSPQTPKTVSGPGTTQASAEPAPSVLPPGTPKERYGYAFNLMRQARYDEAEVAFKAFVAAYGDNALSDNARYWLGETYYVRKRYMDAAQAFFAAYKKAPKGVKAADSLLKLGMSLDSLKKPKDACTTFTKLHKEFSPLKDNIKSILDKEMRRLKCQ